MRQREDKTSAPRGRRTASQWCRRYISPTLLVSLAVIAVVLFLNDNSLMRTYQYQSEIAQLKSEILQYRDTLQYYESLNNSLETDGETLERIVREQYHMQRPNEDVYIFEE